jgi:hypothetical protein
MDPLCSELLDPDAFDPLFDANADPPDQGFKILVHHSTDSTFKIHFHFERKANINIFKNVLFKIFISFRKNLIF